MAWCRMGRRAVVPALEQLKAVLDGKEIRCRVRRPKGLRWEAGRGPGAQAAPGTLPWRPGGWQQGHVSRD